MATVPFPTEIDFSLPRGYIDESGVLHKRGRIRLATAADEILPLRDPRVQANPAYLTIIILARVITRLGNLAEIDTRVVESLFAGDLEYLRRVYEEVNAVEETDAAPPSPAALNGRAAGRGGLQPMGEA